MEIGNSISHFGIVSAQVVFVLLLFALTNIYTKDIKITRTPQKEMWFIVCDTDNRCIHIFSSTALLCWALHFHFQKLSKASVLFRFSIASKILSFLYIYFFIHWFPSISSLIAYWFWDFWHAFITFEILWSVHCSQVPSISNYLSHLLF